MNIIRFSSSPRSHRILNSRRRIAGLVSASLLGVITPMATTTPAHATESKEICAPFVAIGVRGTGFPAGTAVGGLYTSGGLGITSNILTDIQAQSPAGIRIIGLNYPAANFAAFPASLAEGSKTLRAVLEIFATSCPNTKMVLAGHSQGAQVIGDVLASNTTPQLSAAAKQNINSVILLGDSSYTNGEKINSPKSATTGRSLFPRPAGVFYSYTRNGLPIIRSWCYNGDWACQNPLLKLNPFTAANSQALHDNYGNSPTRERAVDFIRSWVE